MQKQLLKKIKPIAICLAACSMMACTGIPRPKGLLCVAHIPEGYNNCYDLEKDFDENGDLLATSTGAHIPLDLNNHVNLDASSFASLKAYKQKLLERYKSCQGN